VLFDVRMTFPIPLFHIYRYTFIRGCYSSSEFINLSAIINVLLFLYKFVIYLSTLVYWEYLSHGDSRVIFYVFLIFMLLSQLSWALTWPLGVRKLGSRKEEMLPSWTGNPAH
jgi:hypothetical protein